MKKCYIILIIVFSLIVISFLLYLLCSYIRISKDNFKKCKEFEKLTAKEKKKLLNILKIINKICKENNIPYWITGGTLLGAVRNGKIISWDDDADIGMFEKDFEKFNSILQNKLKKNNLKIFEKFTRRHYVLSNNNFPHVDIFIWKKNGDNYSFKSSLHRRRWPNQYFTEEELFPLVNYKFENLSLLGPNKNKKYLNRSYPNWEKFGIIFFSSHKYWNLDKRIFCDEEKRKIIF